MREIALAQLDETLVNPERKYSESPLWKEHYVRNGSWTEKAAYVDKMKMVPQLSFNELIS